MKILFVAHSFPYPLHEGVRLHVFYLLKYLSNEHEVHLITFIESEEERRHIPQIAGFCRSVTMVVHRVPKQPWRRLWNILFQNDPYSVRQFWSSRMAAQIQETARGVQPDVVHFDFTVMAQYASFLPDAPKVFHPHDAMSMLFERNVAHERNWLFRWYMAAQTSKMKRYERQILPIFERTVTVSPVDAAVFQKESSDATAVALPNGVDVEFFKPSTGAERPNILLFRGIMSFLPNYDAAVYFAKDVMPLVWRQMPEVEFWIVGGDAPATLSALIKNEPRIRLAGFVPDIRVPMGEATAVVCPMRIGSGIKNKVLESMAMAKAVLATPMSLAGINAAPNQHLLAGETPEQLSVQAVRLLRDPALRQRLGAAARGFVETHHSWKQHAEQFAKLYREAVADKKARNT